MTGFVVVLSVVAVVAAQEPSPKRHSLDRLYSLPWLIGKEPRGFAWAPDSKRLAFLWNDDGSNFADVWVTDVVTARPTRITTMPRRDAMAASGSDLGALQRNVAAEIDPGVGFVLWHPDGERLVFGYRADLYQVRVGAAPIRLTETRGAETRLAFSEDGRLGYLLDGGLWATDPAMGGARALVERRAPAVGVESFRWSPDGKAVAFVETDRSRTKDRLIPDYLGEETSTVPLGRPYPGEESEHRRLGVVPATGGPPTWFDLGGDPVDLIFSYSWSPDSRSLLVDRSDLFVKDRRLLIVDPGGGGVRTLRSLPDTANVSAEWWADWGPDGRGVYYVADPDDDYHLYYQALDGGGPRRLTVGDWAVFRAEIAPAAKAVFLVTNQGRPEDRQLVRLPLGGGSPTRVSWRAGTHTPTISPDGRWAAVHLSSDSAPPDLYLTRLDVDRSSEATERRVTVSPSPEFRDYRWAVPRYVTFKQHQDGVTLHGRLLLPAGFDSTKRYPAILGSVYSNTVRNQWGGRTAHPTWGLDQYLLQQGFVLLNVDISGSSGHGKAFRQRIRLDYGGVDVEDLYSGVLYLKGLGYVDSDRIGIWGSSYGGLLTTMSLFTKPGVYRAGIAGAPATNVWHALTGEMRVMLRPSDQPQRYAASSSHTKAAGLQDHLMIIHGMRDRVVLFKDSVTLLELLLQHGKDVDFVALPNSEHGWDTEGVYQTRFAFKKMVEFFGRHLRGPR